MILGKKGQGALEYAILIACVAGALLAMYVYMKRAVGAKVVSSVDSIGTQFDPNNTTAVEVEVKGKGNTTQTVQGGTTVTTSKGETGEDGATTYRHVKEETGSY